VTTAEGSPLGKAETPLIGSSPLWQQVLQTLDAVAVNDCVVLLEGESGTGKELLAKRIHRKSNRADGPFIPVNCPAVSESLFESQFYGHVKGSFTGASSDTLGVVRAADEGTLFLDEIGELELHLQPKLLRMLQEKEVTPVGSTKAEKVDVRFVAATNRSLAKSVTEGRFRPDLYHRLNVVRIQIPPLRCRPEDVDGLLDYYLRHYAEKYGMDVKELDSGLRKQLAEYPWPGNVRELCCWVERLYAANMPAIAPMAEAWDDGYRTPAAQNAPTPQAWPPAGPAPVPVHSGQLATQAAAGQPAAPAPAGGEILNLAEMEKRAIEAALAKADGNRSEAAEMLGIHRSTLLRKLRDYGLDD
jgi:transcriptional regulator with PAS, ATPase and Fis domain